jgi:hypothetical protein
MPEDTKIKSAHNIIDKTIRQKKRILRKSRSAMTALQRKVKRIASLDEQIVACDERRKILEEQIESAMWA